jgi:hypothetical protein
MALCKLATYAMGRDARADEASIEVRPRQSPRPADTGADTGPFQVVL